MSNLLTASSQNQSVAARKVGEFKKEPVKVGDIIYCKGYQRDGEYFKLTAYDKVL